MKKGLTKKHYDLLKKLGDNIRNLRNNKKISQEELAFKAELDRTYISGIEKGERNISVITLYKLADALEISTSHLLNGKSK